MENILALGGGLLLAVGGSVLYGWDSLEAVVVFCLVVIMLNQTVKD